MGELGKRISGNVFFVSLFFLFCIGCIERDLNKRKGVFSENLEISRKPYYHKHSYKGPIRSVQIINIPEAYTDSNFFGRLKKKNSYMEEINTPLEYESYHTNYYIEFDTLGNRTVLSNFTNTKITFNKDSIFNCDRKRIHLMANSKKKGKEFKPGIRLYHYDYDELSHTKEKHGIGHIYYPPYWNLFSFGAPTYKPVNYIRNYPPVYNKEDTVLTYTRVNPRTGEEKKVNYYRPGFIYKFEVLPQEKINVEKIIKSWGTIKVLGVNDSVFNTSLVSLESYNNGWDEKSHYDSKNYRSINKYIEVNIQSSAEYHYNNLGLLTHKNYTGEISMYKDYANAWIDHRSFNDKGFLDTDYTIPRNRNVDTVVEYFEYDDHYRLTDQYLVTKHNFKDYKQFYYSGNKSMPDSIYANFIRLSNSDTPGDFTGLPFMAHLDENGNITELHYLSGKIVTDSLGHQSFERTSVESKRIFKYSGYDKYGNWTKVDKYVWHNPDEKKYRYYKNEKRKKFWSRTRFVGSQERNFEYYKE